MPTPSEGYRIDGKRVPSVTTIIGRFKESGALLRWAWNEGREGRDLYAARDKAADIGTAAHAMVEASIKGLDPEGCGQLQALDADGQSRARNAFRAYQQWASMCRLEIVEQEVQLVSVQHGFGGTPDAIGRVNGELCLVDWKTSNSVYSDYLLQLAAYRQLWEESYPNLRLTGGFHLCRFSKDFGDFAHHYYSELDGAWQMFLHLRHAYEYDKELRKRAA